MNQNTEKTAVIGGGSWATSLVKLITMNLKPGEKVLWFMRNRESIEFIREHKRNPKYISGLTLETDKIELSNNLDDVVNKAKILVFAIPSAFLTEALANVKTDLSQKLIVSAIKGIIPQHNLIAGEFFNQIYGVPYENIGVITGPCHAEEVALERLSYLTIASENLHFAEKVALMLECQYLKTSISDDIYGTEYSAVLKNIFALASGICSGLGYGDNFQAVLVSNAIREIKRFVDTVHPINRDIKSSAYLGDLLVTAYSKFSRNLIFGVMIGKGYSVKAAQIEMNMVAEGYYAAKTIWEINRNYNIFMPISEAVYNILYAGKPPAFEIKLLTDKLR
jgi:glycerol-3-phosphate dehydrogenase (NAD(P)+)